MFTSIGKVWVKAKFGASRRSQRLKRCRRCARWRVNGAARHRRSSGALGRRRRARISARPRADLTCRLHRPVQCTRRADTRPAAVPVNITCLRTSQWILFVSQFSTVLKSGFQWTLPGRGARSEARALPGHVCHKFRWVRNPRAKPTMHGPHSWTCTTCTDL